MQYMILAIKTSSFTGRKWYFGIEIRKRSLFFLKIDLKWVLDDGKCNLNVKTEEISMYS